MELQMQLLVKDRTKIKHSTAEKLEKYDIFTEGGKLEYWNDGILEWSTMAVRPLIGNVRKGGGPTVLWCELDRLSSHTSSDATGNARCAGGTARAGPVPGAAYEGQSCDHRS